MTIEEIVTMLKNEMPLKDAIDFTIKMIWNSGSWELEKTWRLVHKALTEPKFTEQTVNAQTKLDNNVTYTQQEIADYYYHSINARGNK